MRRTLVKKNRAYSLISNMCDFLLYVCNDDSLQFRLSSRKDEITYIGIGGNLILSEFVEIWRTLYIENGNVFI